MFLNANKYYEDLRFNHYNSGGTCEQRTLVLRVRFDNILEDLVSQDYTLANNLGKDFYSERLKLLFKKYPKKFSKEEQKAIDDLRRFFNQVQHSVIIPGEMEYIRSLKTLCKLIYTCSDTPIPTELTTLFIKDRNLENQRDYPIKKTSKLKCSRLPVSILIDTLNIATTRESTSQFNSILKKFISQILEDDLCVDISLVLIEKNGIKTVKPLEKISSFSPYNEISYQAVNEAIKRSTQFITLGLKNIIDIDRMRIKSLMVLLLSSKTLKYVKPVYEIEEIVKLNQVTILPIGLDNKIVKDNFLNVCPNREAIILTERKYSEFFLWLYECIKIGSKN